MALGNLIIWGTVIYTWLWQCGNNPNILKIKGELQLMDRFSVYYFVEKTPYQKEKHEPTKFKKISTSSDYLQCTKFQHPECDTFDC